MGGHVCPVWVGYLLISPLRKLSQNPVKILSPFVKEGMQVLDIGCAMGFFSLPMARMVGPDGRVICVDLQPRMISSLEKRAGKAGLKDRIDVRVCEEKKLGLHDLAGRIDFALAFAVVHEVPDSALFFNEVYESLKPTGTVLVAETKGHVSKKDFDLTISAAERSGFSVSGSPKIRKSHSVVLKKP